MRLVVWNMGNGGPGASADKHERAWQYLEQQEWDVALLQETRKPPEWAEERYASRVWRPKYARSPTDRALWRCAVIGRSSELEEYEPDEAFPWLEELEGSTAIAVSAANPRWLASVHLHASRIADEVLAARSVEGVEVTTPDRSLYETNVIPHELSRLFGDQTFIWGGDLNTDPRMDDKPWFVGGNRRLFEVYAESGSNDTRARFFDSFQQTYFKPGKAAYQLDHVFADARTEQRVTGWRVDPRPATEEPPYSDHAPIFVTVDATL
jgi:endonuclease/exonuclease/phosphatase family metal-dependent hydrolase